ncbi:HAMP domain-containing sensor histidine kinase [Ammoniphilus sp. YIM 78166]|uniref:sensor histidine kinase n=1 Tax=Ammoniphilus sp. YIM 78166 TaxID=1644106 RepID=UPI001430342C|nr:HAMP domain-containing sensor histidine kinase [Ammoniphilus sp. YIM 78166]
MGLVLIAVWILGFVIWFTDGQRISTRWAAAIAFVGGFGFLSGVIGEVWLPMLQSSGYSGSFEQILQYLENVSSFICQAGLPYAYFMFALYSSPEPSPLWKKRVSWLAFIPVMISLMLTPISPILQFNYWWMISWVVPYVLYASFLLVKLFLKERDPVMKRSHFITILLCVIPLLFVMITIYVLRTVGMYEVWRTNVWIIAAQFVLFLVFSLKYGVLGVRIRVERHRLDNTMRALTSGTDILNHSIKNEVGKIQLFTNRLDRYAEESMKESMQEDLKVIQASADHLLRMVQRIQSKMKDMVLEEEPCDLKLIIEQSVQHLKPLLTDKEISVVVPRKGPDFIIRGDSVHLHEAFTNLLCNAIEALPRSGTIWINLYETKKHLTVSVQDNGEGISRENMPYVLEPFFSTKKNSSTNFGLGLSYCYNVMRKHGGWLDIHSVKGEGTTIFLYFPKKRNIKLGWG